MYDIGNLIRLEKSEVDHAAEVWTRAFEDDPLWLYYFPVETENRQKKLTRALRRVLVDGLSNGEVFATSHDLEAIAVWHYSNRIGVSTWQWIRSGGLVDLTKISFREMTRQARVGELITSIHKRHVDSYHWHFAGIGVDTPYRNKGYASMLIRPMLARIDMEHSLCYLETHNRDNVPIYKHFGFEVVEEGIIPGTDVSQWAMLRERSCNHPLK